ncbi:MAG TPA: hypothetical protein VIG04_03770 [Gemmatimonadales bacterium]|jgi:hypothetical protein
MSLTTAEGIDRYEELRDPELGSYSGDILISAMGATNSSRGVFVHVTK